MANPKNRRPDVAGAILDAVTKVELLEAAYHLATQASSEEGALARLVEEINLGRAHRGEKLLQQTTRVCPGCKGSTTFKCTFCKGTGKVTQW